MKKLAILGIALMPVAASAQKIHIALNAGLQTWTKAGTDMYGCVKLISDNEFAQGGFAIEGGRTSERVSLPYVNWQGQTAEYKDRSGVSYINPYLFMNLKIPANTNFYAGGAVGYFMIWQNAYYYEEVVANPPYTKVHKTPDNRKIISLGAQVGYTSKISENVNFNAEVALRFVALNITRQVSFPASIGLQFRL